MGQRCHGRVWDGSNHFPCSKNASIEVEGKWYCGIHNPMKVKEREDKTSLRYNEKINGLVYQQMAGNYCRKKGLTIEQMEKELKGVSKE